MVQVYVTKMPEVNNECPFFNGSTCNITQKDCCLPEKASCEHLATFFIEVRDEPEGFAFGIGTNN